jgi:hypothetical protein
MSETKRLSEYLVISRGQWDADKPPQEIQAAIDEFYVWIDGLIGAGKMKAGQRLAPPSMTVSKHGVTDGPFTESKEVIGGYWFFIAESLAQAAALAAQNPCLKCGLTLEVRPIETAQCSAYDQTCETPRQRA